MAGHAARFTHSYDDMTHLLRRMREFSHIHGKLTEAMRIASDQREWEPDMRDAYQAVLPRLLWSEHSIMNNEAVLSRDGRIKPAAMLRRIGFLFGVMCVCGAVHGGYSCLPVSGENDPYRRPFCHEDFPHVLESLCKNCREDFRHFCTKMCGDKVSEDEAELCATGWMSSRVRDQALKIVREARDA